MKIGENGLQAAVPDPSCKDWLVRKNFTSHSGLSLSWKIECDGLTDMEIETLAWMIYEKLEFSKVVGIPRGGLRLAAALQQYCCTGGPLLLVDDVCTTTESMENARRTLLLSKSRSIIGVVIFSRCLNLPKWITPIFQLDKKWI